MNDKMTEQQKEQNNEKFDILIGELDEEYFKVDFPEKFNRQMLDAVRQVPGRIWNDELKLWMLPVRTKGKSSAKYLLENLYSIGLYNINNEKCEKTKNNDTSSKLEQNKRLLKKMKEMLEVRHYSPRTIECYMKWVKDFLKQYKNIQSEKLGQKEINEFLTKLAVNYKVSPSTQNQALAGLLFYFRFVKGENPIELESVIRAKKKQRIPVVFSRAEVKKVIEYMPVDKRLCAELLYGTGMRLNELIELRILDVDFERCEIIIRHGKGDKDRHVMLPQSLIPKLKEQIEKVKIIHSKDLTEGWGSVALPGKLEAKYPDAGKEFKWQWLFPQKNRWKNQTTGEEGRWQHQAEVCRRQDSRQGRHLRGDSRQLHEPRARILRRLWRLVSTGGPSPPPFFSIK